MFASADGSSLGGTHPRCQLLFQVAAIPSGKVNQGLKLNTPSEPPMA